MRVHLRLIVLALTAAATMLGQRHGGFSPRHGQGGVPQPSTNANFLSPYRAMPAPPNAHRFGNILFPGGTTTVPPVVHGPVQPFGGYGPALGPRTGSRRNRTIAVPYAVPVFGGGFGYYGYDYGYAPAQQPVTVVVPQQQPPPTVIINNHFGDGEVVRSTASLETDADDEAQLRSERRMKVYEAPRTAAAPPAPGARSAAVNESPNIYTLIGRDGVARQAIGYWVRDGKVHYVTANAQIRQVGLDEIDLEASERVNAQQSVPFELRRMLN